MPAEKDVGGAVVIVVPQFRTMSITGYDLVEDLGDTKLAVDFLRETFGSGMAPPMPTFTFHGPVQPEEPDLVRLALTMLVSTMARGPSTGLNVWIAALGSLLPVRHYSVRVTVYVDALPEYDIHPLKGRTRREVEEEAEEIATEMGATAIMRIEDTTRLH